MKKTVSSLYIPVFLLLLATAPFLLSPSHQDIAFTFLIFSIVALSQDIILGKTGIFNMGQILFFGIGAYVTAILNHQYQLAPLWSLPIAMMAAGLLAILVTTPIAHLRGDYLLVVTIGLNIVFVQVVNNDLGGLTGGPNGIFGIDGMSLLTTPTLLPLSEYYIALIGLMITLYIIQHLQHSKVGRALHYLRQDLIAAKSMGINDRFHKVFAFSLGASIAGMAGSIYAAKWGAVSPDAFQFRDSVLFFSIVIVGGSSLPGILAGVFVMFVLPQIFTEFETWRYFIFGIAMILVMILRPRGVWPATFGHLPKAIFGDK